MAIVTAPILFRPRAHSRCRNISRGKNTHIATTCDEAMGRVCQELIIRVYPASAMPFAVTNHPGACDTRDTLSTLPSLGYTARTNPGAEISEYRAPDFPRILVFGTSRASRS